MMARSEDHYLLVVGTLDQSAGCLETLADAGDYSVDEGSNAADAIERAERGRPSLIVVNLNSAVRSGLDVCRELVAAESTRDVPILAIAGAPEQQFMIALSVMPCDE